VTIAPGFSLDQPHQINHLAPDEVLANDRAEHIVDQADDQNSGSDHDNALHDLTHPEEDHRRGEPDQARAHRGEHGEGPGEGHEGGSLNR
jgi:hypothetical protein